MLQCVILELSFLNGYPPNLSNDCPINCAYLLLCWDGTRLSRLTAILGDYQVLLVPVTDIGKPVDTRGDPGAWLKGYTSSVMW